jgi:hypothetical protein
MTTTTAPTCRTCTRPLAVGEDVWAEDWTVITPDGARNEVRYQCEGCHG